MSTQETIILLDGNALLHRAWHAIPPLTTKKGVVVNAAYGFAMVVEKMLETYKPEYIAVAWDLPGKTFRHELYEAYKAQREKKEQELYDQIPLIQNILEAFGIPSLEAPGFEADDIIGTLSKQSAERGLKTLIVTGDLDSLQLVDENTHVIFFQKGISETKVYDAVSVKERYGLTPDQLIDYKALRGDPSDNIPGIAGIGEKTATMLLQEYGTIQGILKALDRIEEKYAKKLRGQEQLITQSLTLVKIVRDVPLKFSFSSAVVGQPDLEKLLPLYRELEFRTLLKKYQEHTSVLEKKSKESKVIVQIVREAQLFIDVFSSSSTLGVLLAQQPADLFGATLAAIACSDGTQTLVLPNPSKEALEKISFLLLKTKKVVSHDLKHLMHHLGKSLTGSLFDTMIASYLLHSGSRAHDLAGVVFQSLGRAVPEVPITFLKEKDYERFGQIVAILPELSEKMEIQMKQIGAEKVFEEIEMPLLCVLYRMEVEGIELDSASLTSFSHTIQKRMSELTLLITKLAGVEFNLNSPSQLADVLFETLQISTKGIKKTKTGFSTAAPELEKLWEVHPIIPLLSEYRELSKLQSTYVEALPKLVDKDGRVHTTFNQAVASTGRLSSSDPNLQNIPIKTELGR